MGEKVTLEVHPEIDGLTLFCAPPGPHQHTVHARDAFSLMVLCEGAKDFHHQGKTISVTTPQIAVANPGEIHGCCPLDGQPWAHKTWFLSPQLVARLGAEQGLGPKILIKAPLIDDPPMAQQLNAAHDAIRTGELLDRQSEAMQVLTALVGRYGFNSAAARPRQDLSEPALNRLPV